MQNIHAINRLAFISWPSTHPAQALLVKFRLFLGPQGWVLLENPRVFGSPHFLRPGSVFSLALRVVVDVRDRDVVGVMVGSWKCG